MYVCAVVTLDPLFSTKRASLEHPVFIMIGRPDYYGDLLLAG